MEYLVNLILFKNNSFFASAMRRFVYHNHRSWHVSRTCRHIS